MHYTMIDKKAWQLYSHHSNRSDSCKMLYFWHSFNGPGSSQNLLSAFFKREQETLAELWPLLGCETTFRRWVWSKMLHRTSTYKTSEGPQEKPSAPSATPGDNHQVVFFFHKERWTFINPSPRTTNAPQPEWIPLREDYISNPANSFIFLLNLFFTSRPQKYNQGQE